MCRYLYLEVCAGLSPIISTDFEGPSLCILSITVFRSVLLIFVDEIGSCRKHHLGLSRFSVTKSRSRIKKLAVNSSDVDRIFNALWLNSELEFRFRSSRLSSVRIDGPGSRLPEVVRRLGMVVAAKGFSKLTGIRL